MLGLIVSLASIVSACHYGNMSNDVIVENEDFTVTGDSVTMHGFTARSTTGQDIVTNYHGKALDSIDNVLKFRLLIADRDIELLPAQYHYIDIDKSQTTVKAFEPDSVKPSSSHQVALPVAVNVNIDFGDMLKTLNDKGFFVTPSHDTIYNKDFEAATVEIALATGNPSHNIKVKLEDRAIANGVCPVTIPLEKKQPAHFGTWSSTIDPKAPPLPSYESKQLLMNAIYNMSMREIDNEKRGEHTALVAGKCYDIALSLAYLRPQQSIDELKAMVVDSVINTEHQGKSLAALGNDLIWSQAAWSVYCATGDKSWLAYSYKVIINSLRAFNGMAATSDNGLYQALCPYTSTKASQYYPTWATAVDAFETMPLVTNAIVEHTYTILGQIADEFELNKDYDTKAGRLKDAINHRLWNESRGCYSQYLYGGVTPIMSPCVDNMGHALAILWDIADDDRTEAIIKETPITNYGVTLLYPNRAGMGTGLNNTVIPMVQAMWNLAAAKASNMGMLRRGMGAMILQQALAGTCATCCNATTGEILDYDNPRGNAAGNVAMVFRVLAGMKFLPNGIEFNPKVPVCFGGNKSISGFAYRKALLNITIKGTGDDCAGITLDGKKLDDNFINGNLEGKHDIVITMNDNYAGSGVTTLAQKMKELPESPLWLWDGYYGTNYSYDNALGYRILINGVPTYSMRDSVMGTRDTVTYRNYSIVAINKYGNSYISRPHYITTTARCYRLASKYPHLSTPMTLPQHYPHHPIELTHDSTSIDIPVVTTEAGSYVVDVMYSNGNGPQAWGSPCDLLSVYANGHRQGVVAVPHSGIQQWLTMTYSSHLTVKLLKGRNIITLQRVQASSQKQTKPPLLLDHIRLIKQTNKK